MTDGLAAGTDLLFADWSNDQAEVEIPAYRAETDVLAHEVTWGTDVTMPAGRLPQLRGAKFTLLILYLGLVADQDVGEQVSAFVEAIGELGPSETWMLDWEDWEGHGTPTPAQRDQAHQLLCEQLDRPLSRALTYGPASLLEEEPPPYGFLWAASYGSSEPSLGHSLWQFTDGQIGSFPAPEYSPKAFAGVGYCDANVFHGTSEQLLELLVPESPQPPPPPIGEPRMYATDLETKLPYATDAEGDFFAGPGTVPHVVTLAMIRERYPTLKCGTPEEPCVGITPQVDVAPASSAGQVGYTFITKPATPVAGSKLGPYNAYHVNRDGTY